MSFARTAFVAAAGWVAAITLLHAYLNWGGGARKFRVGFLPVT
jgi:hypothetical protein